MEPYDPDFLLKMQIKDCLSDIKECKLYLCKHDLPLGAHMLLFRFKQKTENELEELRAQLLPSKD